MRLALYSPDVPGAAGGVSDHTLVLARALAARGADVVVLARSGEPERFSPIPCVVGVRPLAPHGTSLADALRAANADWVLVQYVPFLYARRGVAPSLVAGLLAARRAGVRIALFVHEPFVPFSRLPWLVTGVFQRAQLFALLRMASLVYTAVPGWVSLLRRWGPARTPVRLAPVGATLPRSALTKAEARTRLGFRESEVAIGVFSPSASGFLIEWIEAARSATAQAAGVRWFLFGRSAAGVRARIAGNGVAVLAETPAVEVSNTMAAMDISLAPYVDGLTLRRTSAMLALSHGVATVSSSGPLFDTALGAAARCPATREAFVRDVEELVADRELREALGAAGRTHYEREASVEVLADRLWRDVTAGGA